MTQPTPWTQSNPQLREQRAGVGRAQRGAAVAILGAVQFTLALLGGAGWMFLGVGVAMCTDSGTSAYCDDVSRQWLLTGLALALNAVSGIVLLCTARQARTSRALRIGAWLSGMSALLLLIVGPILVHTALMPIP